MNYESNRHRDRERVNTYSTFRSTLKLSNDDTNDNEHYKSTNIHYDYGEDTSTYGRESVINYKRNKR